MEQRSNGLSLTTILFVVFLVLKLVGTIDWSWWWVTSPLWIPWAVVGAGALLFLVFKGIFALRRTPKINHYGVTPRKQKKLLRRGGR